MNKFISKILSFFRKNEKKNISEHELKKERAKRCWVHKNGVQRYILLSEYDEYIKHGYIKGRVKKK